MKNLKEILRSKLGGARRVAVLAIGSRLRADDEAGLLAADALDAVHQPKPGAPVLAVFMGETTPESLTGEIRRFGPSHVVLLDAADFGGKPGHVAVIPPDAPSLNASASTHGLPLAVLSNYLRQSIGCEVVILGIQSASRTFGHPPTKAVRLGAHRAAAALAAALDFENT